MGTPSDASAALARRVLAHEAGGLLESQPVVEALDRVCQRLYNSLIPLIGPRAFAVLMNHALSRTRQEFPVLAGVTSDVQQNGCFLQLGQAVRGHDPEEVTSLLVALLGRFVWLLTTFIGEGLTLRLVCEAWPEIPWGRMEPASRVEPARGERAS